MSRMCPPDRGTTLQWIALYPEACTVAQIGLSRLLKKEDMILEGSGGGYMRSYGNKNKYEQNTLYEFI